MLHPEQVRALLDIAKDENIMITMIKRDKNHEKEKKPKIMLSLEEKENILLTKKRDLIVDVLNVIRLEQLVYLSFRVLSSMARFFLLLHFLPPMLTT